MMEVVNVGQRVDGDLGLVNALGSAFQTITGTYIGGQPVGIGPSGLIFGTDLASSCCSFLGAIYNNSLIDTRIGAQEVVLTTDLTVAKPAVVYPGNKIKVYQGDVQSDASAPYENVVWGVGDDVYISSGGLWTNVSSTGCTQSWGKVINTPTSYGDPLIFEFSSYTSCV